MEGFIDTKCNFTRYNKADSGGYKFGEGGYKSDVEGAIMEESFVVMQVVQSAEAFSSCKCRNKRGWW